MHAITPMHHIEVMADNKLSLSEAGTTLLSQQSFDKPVDSKLLIEEQLALLGSAYQTLRNTAGKNFSTINAEALLESTELQALAKTIYTSGSALNGLLSFESRLEKLKAAVTLLNSESMRDPTYATQQLNRILPEALNGWTANIYQEMATFVDDWQKDISSILKSQSDKIDPTTKDYLQDAAEIARLTAGKIAELQRQYAESLASHID